MSTGKFLRRTIQTKNQFFQKNCLFLKLNRFGVWSVSINYSVALLFFENYIVCCYFLLNLYYLQVFIIVICVKTSTSEPLKTWKLTWMIKLINQLLVKSIFDIKALVQEQSTLILKLTETFNSQRERIVKLEESLIECENSLQISKTVSSWQIKKCDDLEQYRRRLCLGILDVAGDDSETSDDVFNKYTETNCIWIYQEPVLAGRVG